MKVVICGSRTITDKQMVFNCINAGDKTFDITEVISGGAKGVDTFAHEWALKSFVKFTRFKADEKDDGPLRDKAMVDNGDAVIAVWDGKSKGTKHTIDLARAAGKPCRVYRIGQMES